VQDHVKPELLFLATEFGVYFSINSGQKWTKLKGGTPTISFRDLAIQKRENDLVAASFGRGIFILDDYSALRELTEESLNAEAALFSTRKAWWYIPRSHLAFYGKKGDQGASHFVAPNPPYGAVFTYHLKENLQSKKAARKAADKKAMKEGKTVPFQGWGTLSEEFKEDEPKIWLIVKDSKGAIIRRIEGKTTKGFHRIAWDLKYPTPNVIDLEKPKGGLSWGGPPTGLPAAPGTYSVSLSKSANGVVTELAAAQKFEVVPMKKGHLQGAKIEDVAGFWRRYESAVRTSGAINLALRNSITRIHGMKTALQQSRAEAGDLDIQIHQLRSELNDLNTELYGDANKNSVGEKVRATVGERMFKVSLGVSNSTYGPTETNKETMSIIENQLADMRDKLTGIQAKMVKLGEDLVAKGAPWVEGGTLPRIDK